MKTRKHLEAEYMQRKAKRLALHGPSRRLEVIYWVGTELLRHDGYVLIEDGQIAFRKYRGRNWVQGPALKDIVSVVPLWE